MPVVYRMPPDSPSQPMRRQMHSEPRAMAQRPTHLPAIVHRLTPIQGIDIVVPFAEVFELLASQLEQPNRLAPRHRIPCRADIFASMADAPWGEVVAAVGVDLERAGAVAPLTEPLAQSLGLQSFLGAPAPVISLLVIEDPTVPPPEHRRWDDAPMRETGRAKIPDRFAKDWDFTCSRKTAVALARKARRRARSWWGRLIAKMTAGRARKQRATWSRRLAGRSLEEQLFGVRPGTRLLLDGPTRRWVRGALSLGGYDVDRMLNEWEIHWRRKGV